MKLCLVTNLSKQKVSFTGIGRYADALKKYLLIDTSILYAEDFAGSSAVLRTFPLQLPFKNYSPETIFHLTCQTFTIPLIWQKPKQPVIVTVHDIIPMVTKKYYGFADKILTFLTLRGLKKATHLIADSEHTKKDIIAHLHIPENKISVVPLGVDHTKFYPSKAKKQKNTILYVGSEHARKNLPVLIRAIAEVKKTIPSVILVKVGESQDEKEHTSLVQLIKKENLESNITWKGYVDNLTQEYQQASLFIYPSLYEGFGFPVLEAMACGCPVICTNKTSLPEIAGDAALFFEGYDHLELAKIIKKILTTETLQMNLRKKGIVQAKKFMWETCAEKTKKVYLTVVSQKIKIKEKINHEQNT